MNKVSLRADYYAMVFRIHYCIEQEAVIDRLRETSASSNAVYLIGLQAAIGLSFLL